MRVPRRDAAGAPPAGAPAEHPKTMLMPRRDAANGPPAGAQAEYPKTMLMPRRDVGSELPAGTRLQEFVVEGLVGVGGFSIVYRVRDTRLDRVVAIKEYIPAALATRGERGEVVARSPNHREHFDLGLKSFINEARLLASFDHPALVKVYRFWAENGTAYMVMPYYQGMTLKQWLASLGAPPSEAWLRALAGELLDALAALHHENCFHRDVAPDNILLLHDRHGGTFLEQRPRPLLLDFGAARRVISDATQNLTAILKPGYSPVEQYDGELSLRQGPWTDVYALSAVLYAAVAGKVPPSSIARVVRDDLLPAARAGGGRFSPPFLAAIDAGLAIWPQQRPQSMRAWKDWFEATAAMPPALAAPAALAATLPPGLPDRPAATPPVGGWRQWLPAWLLRWLA
jgi:serine/threonine protein kinase